MAKERRFEPDVVRCGAAVLVLWVHFFLNTEFGAQPLIGKGLTLSVILRSAFMPCVPLFIMLTGYLEVGKNWKKGYVHKLLPVLVIYLFCAVASVGFSAVHLHTPMTLQSSIKEILRFTIPYGWYVGMYIGLFLLAPIFDVAWRAMEDWQKRWTVCALLFITALPVVVSLLPSFWVGSYPVCYYFLGRYLREKPVKAKSWVLLLGWGSLATVGGLLHVWLAQGGPFSHPALTNYNSPLTALEAVCAFSLLVRVREERCPRPCRWLIHRISRLSLPLFLLSYIYDAYFYPLLNKMVPRASHRVLFFPLMTLGSLLCSGLLAQLVVWITGPLLKKENEWYEERARRKAEKES